MKKKTLTKKLSLNKEQIASLNPDEMSRIIGASILMPCSDSCSVFLACCDPLSRTDCDPVEKMGKG